MWCYVLEYNKANIQFARALRKNMTPWERKLWFEFFKEYPLKIQRQKPIDNYIVDFFCAKAHLAIELDGNGHYSLEKAKADNIRTEKLNKLGVDVIRFCNLDVDKNFTGVCEMIDREIRKRYVF